MKIGLFGGSFDPIHYGHILPVRAARDSLALDQVLYLPTARAPHKPRREVSALARFCMVELALLNEPRMQVSTFELKDRVTYTIDTLEHFHRQQPAAHLVLILGSDSLAQLDTWRQWRKILQLAELAVLERPGTEARPDALPAALRTALSTTRVHRIDSAPLAISSTDLRHRIAKGSRDLAQFLPSLVLDYIEKYGLYQST